MKQALYYKHDFIWPKVAQLVSGKAAKSFSLVASPSPYQNILLVQKTQVLTRRTFKIQIQFKFCENSKYQYSHFLQENSHLKSLSDKHLLSRD